MFNDQRNILDFIHYAPPLDRHAQHFSRAGTGVQGLHPISGYRKINFHKFIGISDLRGRDGLRLVHLLKIP
jgi:hypothetical protein